MVIPESFPAFIATKSTVDGAATVERGISTLQASDLPPGEVTVRVEWSGVNYKDALATLADGGVARISPLVAGVDLAGVVVAVDGPSPVSVGDKVIAHGYDIGVARHGGYASYARVLGTQVVALPPGLTTKDAMTIGTGGFTAAESILALEQRGLTPAAGDVLVTGATGGVGSMAISMLAGSGYRVVASTGKAHEHEFLRNLGAAEILDRSETSAAGRPMDKERWAGVIDCVGGTTLAYALRTTRYGGAVAASGLTGGAGLSTTVLPFILRGVSLLGIDSVQLAIEQRLAVWDRCATDLKPSDFASLSVDIGLEQLDGALTAIRAGLARGRFTVRVAD